VYTFLVVLVEDTFGDGVGWSMEPGRVSFGNRVRELYGYQHALAYVGDTPAFLTLGTGEFVSYLPVF
jgi:hypothetical protein